MTRWTVAGEEVSCRLRLSIIAGNGELWPSPNRTGMKLKRVEAGIISRCVRSKAWQKTLREVGPS